MLIASGLEMLEIDKYAIEKLGVPSEKLMENAAKAVMKAVLKYVKEKSQTAVFCGSGNNGGDGKIVARLLNNQGIYTRCFLISEEINIEEVELFCKDYDIIIDAIFGIGLNRAVEGKAVEVIKLINSLNKPVIAVDMPSGISADTGEIRGEAVKATETITFSMPKFGQMVTPGALYCGKIEIADIGIPKEAFETAKFHGRMTDAKFVSKFFPTRNVDSHKGDYGKVLIIAGSEGMTGAALLAAKAALRCGSGLVSVGVPRNIYSIVATGALEAMVFPLPDKRKEILKRLENCDVCLIGPGMGISEESSVIVANILQNASVPVVIDADAITAISKQPKMLQGASCPKIITPHDGEFKRLGGFQGKNRLNSAIDFAKKHNCTLVLKGCKTITANSSGFVWCNTTGNAGMATAGSGDVLAGVIASIIGRGYAPDEAVAAAVWVHGKAGDICAEKFGQYGMTAGDLIEALPKAILPVL